MRSTVCFSTLGALDKVRVTIIRLSYPTDLKISPSKQVNPVLITAVTIFLLAQNLQMAGFHFSEEANLTASSPNAHSAHWLPPQQRSGTLTPCTKSPTPCFAWSPSLGEVFGGEFSFCRWAVKPDGVVWARNSAGAGVLEEVDNKSTSSTSTRSTRTGRMAQTR